MTYSVHYVEGKAEVSVSAYDNITLCSSHSVLRKVRQTPKLSECTQTGVQSTWCVVKQV